MAGRLLPYESATVYREKNTGRFIVQPMCSIPPTWAPGDYGEPTVLAPDDFETQIRAAVLAGLDRFHQQEYKPERARKLSKQEYSRFTREHDMVSVTRLETGRIEVNPFERIRGGYRGLNSEMIVLEPREAEERLAWAIREAFGRIE